MVQLVDKPEALFELSYYKYDLKNYLILRGWVSLVTCPNCSSLFHVGEGGAKCSLNDIKDMWGVGSSWVYVLETEYLDGLSTAKLWRMYKSLLTSI